MKKILLGAAGAIVLGVLVAATPSALGPVLRLANVALASFPAASAANEGGLLYDSTNNAVKFSDGSAWQDFTTSSPLAYSGAGRVLRSCLVIADNSFFADWPDTAACVTKVGSWPSTSVATLGGTSKTYSSATASTTSAVGLYVNDLFHTANQPRVWTWARTDRTTSIYVVLGGFTGQPSSSAGVNLTTNTGINQAFFAIDTDRDATDFLACVSGDGVIRCVSTGVALDTGWHNYDVHIVTDSSGAPTAVNYRLDGTLTNTLTDCGGSCGWLVTTVGASSRMAVKTGADLIDNVGSVTFDSTGFAVEYQ